MNSLQNSWIANRDLIRKLQKVCEFLTSMTRSLLAEQDVKTSLRETQHLTVLSMKGNYHELVLI